MYRRTGRRVQEIEKEVNVDFAGEERAGGWVDEEDALEEIESRDDEEIILPVGGFGEEAFEGCC